MNLFTPAALAAALCLSSIPLALADCATGQSFTQGDITVSGAFVRATLKGAQSAGGYLTISNKGAAPDTFTGASSGAATDIDIHSMKMNGQVMEMAPVAGGLEVPAGGSVSLDPMGYHLMLTGFSQPFVQGQCVAMVLHFAKAGDLPVQFNVGGIAQKTPPGAGTAPSGGVSVMPSGSMDMGSMEMGG
jgi:copper(I)-binding protein